MSEHDKICDATSRLTDVYYQLQRLGSGFHETGNDIVADRLWLMADDIEKARNDVLEAVGEMLSGRLRDAQQSSGNMLKLSIALLSRNKEATP